MENDLNKLIEEFYQIVTESRLASFKRIMTEAFGVDFDKKIVVLSEELRAELDLDLPNPPDHLREGVTSSMFVEGLSFYIIDRPKPFVYQKPVFPRSVDTYNDLMRITNDELYRMLGVINNKKR